MKKASFLMVLGVVSAGIFFSFGARARSLPPGTACEYAPKPYMIVFDRPTVEDYARCKASSDCMDVLDLADLPSRGGLDE